MKDLKARMRRKDRFWPRRYDLSTLGALRTVREFDDTYTAPHFGFKDAADYYHRASAMRIIERVRIPTLIIAAEDDPFVPPQPFRDRKVTGNPNIQVALSAHGGHCAFVGPASGEDDGYWAEGQIVDFVARAWAGHVQGRAGQGRASSAPTHPGGLSTVERTQGPSPLLRV